MDSHPFSMEVNAWKNTNYNNTNKINVRPDLPIKQDRTSIRELYMPKLGRRLHLSYCGWAGNHCTCKGQQILYLCGSVNVEMNKIIMYAKRIIQSLVPEIPVNMWIIDGDIGHTDPQCWAISQLLRPKHKIAIPVCLLLLVGVWASDYVSAHMLVCLHACVCARRTGHLSV